ncbi:BCAS3 microtubule associated cell migration factor-like [Amphiura filiformis]|uniref:BCAS3 microtubule associated cell migration factor-like n=1 Tax=Amphiura filiformis TaxID=82378 RepID=UPI003B21BB33
MATVVDFFHEAYSGSKPEDVKDKILWVKFEQVDTTELVQNMQYVELEGPEPPLFLLLGYSNGVQIWSLPASGEAQEVLSLRRGPVRILRILPTPHGSTSKMQYHEKRPLLAVCDGASSSQPFCSVGLLSLKTGETVHTITFKTPVCDVLCNKRLIVIALQEKVAAFDAVTFKSVFCITSCYPATGPNLNPMALGTRWLAYADRKLVHVHQSGGGVCKETMQSYKATVIHAAKAITKGISVFSESLGKLATSSRQTTASSPPRTESLVENQTAINNKNGYPGVVSVIDTLAIEGEFNVAEDVSCDAIVAHFVAHINEPIAALAFDPSGMLLTTVGAQGHTFHVFRILNHPCGSSQAAAHHLYVLYRGDTVAKVQDISFTNDSRWVAVTTMRETTHIFPITPYGGSVGARTHTSAKIVNKESRFHKSAGLEELEEAGRGSPVHTAGLSESPTSQGFHTPDSFSSLNQQSALNATMGNPRLPPYPKPATIAPLAQIKHLNPLANVGSVTGMSSTNSTRVRSPGQAPVSDYVGISTCFANSRAYAMGSSAKGPREKTDAIIKSSIVESLYIMSCDGQVVEHQLEPKAGVSTVTTTSAQLSKVDDAPLELVTLPLTQWNLQRGVNWQEVQAPLPASSPLILMAEVPEDTGYTNILGGQLVNSMSKSDSSDSLSASPHSHDSDFDEPWLAQVEMVTHTGPHRRLWMGPQFQFKTVPQPSSTAFLSATSSALLSDSMENQRTVLEMTTDDIDLRSLRIQPLRSEPMPTPQMQHYAEPMGRQRSSSHCSQDSATSSSMIEYGSGK